MVDPVSREEHAQSLRWLKIGMTLLVGVSAGLITSQGDASLEVVIAAVSGGLLLGAFLVWYLFPDVSADPHSADNRFE